MDLFGCTEMLRLVIGIEIRWSYNGHSATRSTAPRHFGQISWVSTSLEFQLFSASWSEFVFISNYTSGKAKMIADTPVAKFHHRILGDNSELKCSQPNRNRLCELNIEIVASVWYFLVPIASDFYFRTASLRWCRSRQKSTWYEFRLIPKSCFSGVICGWKFVKYFQAWHDEFLSWDPKNYAGIHITYISTEKVWTPDLSVYNRLVLVFLFCPEGMLQLVICRMHLLLVMPLLWMVFSSFSM